MPATNVARVGKQETFVSSFATTLSDALLKIITRLEGVGGGGGGWGERGGGVGCSSSSDPVALCQARRFARLQTATFSH